MRQGTFFVKIYKRRKKSMNVLGYLSKGNKKK